MSPPFPTSADADRLLGLADQFLEDWAEDAARANPPDTDFDERYAEWQTARPVLAAAPELLAALEAQAFADADPEAARRKGYYDEAKRLRDDVLRRLGSKAVRL